MKEYRAAAWSRRYYENHLLEMGEGTGGAGSISACIEVGEGACMLKGQRYAGLVLSSQVNAQAWDLVFGDSASLRTMRPDFILLSGEPEIGELHEDSWMTRVDHLMDGSNRSWYKLRVQAKWEGIYLTDRSGAFVKRW